MFFFNDTATTEIYTLSLHDALPICEARGRLRDRFLAADVGITGANFLIAETGSSVIVTNEGNGDLDRKSTRLNSSHANISYAVFCLKKKTKKSDSTYALPLLYL